MLREAFGKLLCEELRNLYLYQLWGWQNQGFHGRDV